MIVDDKEKLCELAHTAMRALGQILQALTSSTEKTASNLHGPAIRSEDFIGAGAAAHRYGCSDDSIRRHAKLHDVPKIFVGNRVKFAIRELDKVMRRKI